MQRAYSIHVRGVVQGVGFRPFVYHLAHAHRLTGWVLNGMDGVEIHLEGDQQPLQSFLNLLETQPPPAAAISSLEVKPAPPSGFTDFSIRLSREEQRPTARISPDLPVCDDCLAELFNPADRRFHYPYINCTSCGPRYTIIRDLPYDRVNTTMAEWTLDPHCSAEYSDPANRRFHAQPIACPECGPQYVFRTSEDFWTGGAAIDAAAASLAAGQILAVKGLGGYHLACNATNSSTVAALRSRKFRKEKPFALMARTIDAARILVRLSPEEENLLRSTARPIVLAQAKAGNSIAAEVAPDCDEFGVMLPYTPLHHLLFAAGAPEILVMTSANRSSEPIAYTDEHALQSLCGIADAFLIGERPIARRVDDSLARVGAFGPAILRRARGYAPAAVATFPTERTILALGADLKNSITLVSAGQAFVSQHLGDLEHFDALRAFRETVADLLDMYEVCRSDLLVVHDAHPQYASALQAAELGAAETLAVQHHRAHIASVLAERAAWDTDVIGVSFDGTGYGDDGTVWGGEFFAGSLRFGFERVAHLRPALLPGGDAAAEFPVQAAAGFLASLPRSSSLPDFAAAPFYFPARYRDALELIRKNCRTFTTTSVGRLFDAAAALLGFTREITFEGQAAMWLERLARQSGSVEPYPFPFADSELDFRPLLSSLIQDRMCGRNIGEIARAFQLGLASGVANAVRTLCAAYGGKTVALSGGVFQNELLLADLKCALQNAPLEVWTNHAVPANDGGISFGQAAIAAFAPIGLEMLRRKS